MPSAQPLPEDIDALETLVRQQRDALSECDAQIAQLREQIRLLLAQRFGAASERVIADAAQLTLFNEAEAHEDLDTDSDAAPDTVTVAEHTRRAHRRPLPEALARVQVVHDLPEHDKRCPHDGTALQLIGEDTSEQIDIVPASVRVLRHVRLKYACPCCRQHVVSAPMPAQPIPRSQATPGLLATVAVGKYVDALPLYRQSAQFQRIGVDLPRQMLAHWMVRCGRLVQPLVNLLRDRLLESFCIQMDETPVQVLKEPGKTAQATAYMWVQRSGERERPVVLFDYDPSRSGQVPARLLGAFGGYLQSDGYTGYDAVVAANGLTQVYCMAHARRYFTDALKALGLNPGRLPDKPPDKARRLIKALSFIAHLYAIEHRLRHDTPEARHNAIRPFVVGKKNWLFADTVAGAQASANLYSLVVTARANALEPYAYLRRVFTELPAATTVEDVETLLPWNLQGAG